MMADLSVLNREDCQQFNTNISHYIGAIFGSAWVPIPGAAMAVEFGASKELARFGFKTFIPSIDEDTQTQILRTFLKKRFALKSMEFIPFAGAVIGILHVYGKAHFIMEIAAASHGDSDYFGQPLDTNLNRLWGEFEPRLWDGQELLAYYRETTGLTLSDEVSEQFNSTLKTIESTYRKTTDAIPGFENLQEQGEEFVHTAGEFAKSALSDGAELAKSGLKEVNKAFGSWFGKDKG